MPFLSSLTGLIMVPNLNPALETLGYFRSSLRDWYRAMLERTKFLVPRRELRDIYPMHSRILFALIALTAVTTFAADAKKPVLLYSRYFNAPGEARYQPDG